MIIDRVNNIVHGTPEPKNATLESRSLADYIYQRLSQFPDQIVLINGLDSEQLTAIALRDQSIRVADCLRQLGVADHDKVAFMCENRLELAAVIFGTLLLGATAVPMNPTYSAREVKHALQQSDPKVIFTSANVLEILKVALSQSLSQPILIAIGDAVPTHEYLAFDTFVGNPRVETDANTFWSNRQIQTEKVALLLSSSGTTGLPKAVQLTEQNLLMSIAHVEFEDDAEHDRHVPYPVLLTVSPWSHTFGCIVLINFIACHRPIIFLPKFVDHHYLAAIEKYKVNFLHVVPPLMMFLATHPLVDAYDLSSLKSILCAAAPLSKELKHAVRNRIGAPVFRNGYGLTEATLTVCRQSDKFQKSDSIGELYCGFSGRVVDVETGMNLGANQRGELQFRGKKIMKGYAGDPVATADAIDADGWLHTGDLGYYDENGEWFIVDRLKELIKYNGFQVPPAEIEGLLLQHPCISDAGVCGVPDVRFGELATAYVVRNANGAQLTEQDIVQFVAGHISRPKQLHGGVRFVDVIPRNASGKILRRELRDAHFKKQRLVAKL